MRDVIRPGDVDEDRMDRTKRIGWVDIDKVQSCRVFVVGAGALGNEVVKDLALFGFREIDVLDMDTVVRSNLNRCVLFREGDQCTGGWKSDLVAQRAMEICPDAKIRPLIGTVQDIGPDEMRGYDMIFGCLDNIAARLHLNANSYHARVPYVDGGTDGFRGRVQVVTPIDSPCMQCGMNRSHFKIMERRFSCTGQDAVYYKPKMAAEITTTSIIAAIQVREAIKIISGQVPMRHVLYYDGLAGTSEVLTLDVDPDCPNHIGTSLS